MASLSVGFFFWSGQLDPIVPKHHTVSMSSVNISLKQD